MTINKVSLKKKRENKSQMVSKSRGSKITSINEPFEMREDEANLKFNIETEKDDSSDETSDDNGSFNDTYEDDG